MNARPTINLLTAIMQSDPCLPISLLEALEKLADRSEDSGGYACYLTDADLHYSPVAYDVEMIENIGMPRVRAYAEERLQNAQDIDPVILAGLARAMRADYTNPVHWDTIPVYGLRQALFAHKQSKLPTAMLGEFLDLYVIYKVNRRVITEDFDIICEDDQFSKAKPGEPETILRDFFAPRAAEPEQKDTASSGSMSNAHPLSPKQQAHADGLDAWARSTGKVQAEREHEAFIKSVLEIFTATHGVAGSATLFDAHRAYDRLREEWAGSNGDDGRISADRAAQIAHVSKMTICRWASARPALGKKVGSRWRIDTGVLYGMIALQNTPSSDLETD